MTLDEAIDYVEDINRTVTFTEECEEDFFDSVAQMLEELKYIRRWKSDIMEDFCKCDCNSIDEVKHNAKNKAIDDLFNLIKSNAKETNHYKYYSENNVMDILYFEEDIKKCAEQLKSQN